MTMYRLATNLCRIREAWERFHARGNATIKAKMKSISFELQTRDMAAFRNTIAAQ
ncbi:hypothetical protein [Tahibacter sp.]|uniref:hypothetical protein n=1 Tax=Tahibacter sp. TaxID=2056211 RepID=UPI0028C43623|nr:hypothetical protein [Tahibacter sp.]